MSVKLLVGNFTFLDPQIDGEDKTIIHEILGVFECRDEDHASEMGEELLEEFESYLVPSVYGGEIIYEPNPEKNIKEMYK